MRLLRQAGILPIGISLVATLAACRIGPPPNAALRSTDQHAFWQRLSALCGQGFAGRMAEGADSVFVRNRLTIHVGGCTAREVRIAFVIGPDSSRAWVVRRIDGGALELRHEADGDSGTGGAATGYGGVTRGPGSAARQDFAADARTARLLPAAAENVWSLEIDPGRALAYTLSRPGASRRFRLEFDLRRPLSGGR